MATRSTTPVAVHGACEATSRGHREAIQQSPHAVESRRHVLRAASRTRSALILEQDVVEGIHRVEEAFVNWYLVEQRGRLTIVDAGVPGSWESLGLVLRTLGRSLEDVEALVLTHAHFDHIGFAEEARRRLAVPVHVHENDVPLTRAPRRYARERSPLPYALRHPRAALVIASFVRERAFWPRPIGQVQRFSGGTLPVPGTPRVLPTPGHTLGHVSLHLPDRDVVIAGDALVTLNPYTGATGPQIVARAANADSERALASLAQLEQTEARCLLPGHGEAWRGGAEAAVAMARLAGVS